MRYAIVSDIHANRQAWEAVLADIQGQQTDAILCLGDVVGYGPMPGPTLQSVREHADGIVLGNHDAVIGGRLDVEIFNDNACRIIEWTRDRLSDEATGLFAGMMAAAEVDDFLIVHAEVADPERFDYIDMPETARESFAACDNELIFVGHTHDPGLFIRDEDTGEIFAAEAGDFHIEPGMRYIVNAGSVGDPRCEDIRACYCLYDSDFRHIAYRRVPFDIPAYQADLERSGLFIRPHFLMTLADTAEIEGGPIQDWIVHTSLVPIRQKREPAKVIRITRTRTADAERDAAEEMRRRQEEEEALAEQARIRQHESRKEQIREAIAMRLQMDQERRMKKEQMAEDMRRRLKMAQKTAEKSRLAKEAEDRQAEQARAEEAEHRKQQLRISIAERTQRDKDRRNAEKRAIRERLEEAKRAAEQAKAAEKQKLAAADAAKRRAKRRADQLRDGIRERGLLEQEQREAEREVIRRRLGAARRAAEKTTEGPKEAGNQEAEAAKNEAARKRKREIQGAALRRATLDAQKVRQKEQERAAVRAKMQKLREVARETARIAEQTGDKGTKKSR